MSLIKKSDVQEYFASKKRARLSDPMASALPGPAKLPKIDAPDTIALEAVFVADFSLEHSALRITIDSVAPLPPRELSQ